MYLPGIGELLKIIVETLAVMIASNCTIARQYHASVPAW